jgi:hypothetical protein
MGLGIHGVDGDIFSFLLHSSVLNRRTVAFPTRWRAFAVYRRTIGLFAVMLLEAVKLLGRLAIQRVARNGLLNLVLVAIVSNICTDAFPFASPCKLAPFRGNKVGLWLAVKEIMRTLVVFIPLIIILSTQHGTMNSIGINNFRTSSRQVVKQDLHSLCQGAHCGSSVQVMNRFMLSESSRLALHKIWRR